MYGYHLTSKLNVLLLLLLFRSLYLGCSRAVITLLSTAEIEESQRHTYTQKHHTHTQKHQKHTAIQTHTHTHTHTHTQSSLEGVVHVHHLYRVKLNTRHSVLLQRPSDKRYHVDMLVYNNIS